MTTISLKEIEEELFTAIQALEDGDLIKARGCVARANSDIVELWQSTHKREPKVKK